MCFSKSVKPAIIPKDQRLFYNVFILVTGHAVPGNEVDINVCRLIFKYACSFVIETKTT